jgi:two-component system, NarL family, nitrate/nitrite response regulator NarL
MQGSKATRLAIIDDHPIVIDGIKALVEGDPGIAVVLTTTSPKTLLDALEHTRVDVLLTDIVMPEMNGNELAKLVKQKFPSIKILALSMSGQADVVNEMISDADISGYILKNVSRDDLLTAIHKIARGGIYFSEAVLAELDKYKAPKQQESILTHREVEIISLMEKEFGNKEIATQLFISERTVETHRKNIFRKLGKNTLIGVIKYAYDHKIIQPPT